MGRFPGRFLTPYLRKELPVIWDKSVGGPAIQLHAWSYFVSCLSKKMYDILFFSLDWSVSKNQILKGLHSIIFVSNIFPNSHLIQICMQLFWNSCWLCIHFWIKWELGKILETKMIGWSPFTQEMRAKLFVVISVWKEKRPGCSLLFLNWIEMTTKNFNWHLVFSIWIQWKEQYMFGGRDTQ